MSDNSPT
jgi:hypothetical protein